MLEDDGFGIDNDLGSSEQLLIATEALEMSNNYEVMLNSFDGGNGDQRRQGCQRNAQEDKTIPENQNVKSDRFDAMLEL